MDPATHSSDSIERFAELSALLDEPFADRQAVLRAAGLDDERWTDVVERWAALLATAEGEVLAVRFGDAFVAARRPCGRPKLEAAPEPMAPRFPSTTEHDEILLRLPTAGGSTGLRNRTIEAP